MTNKETKDGYIELIDASIYPNDNKTYAEFRNEDKRWYILVNEEMIALEDIIESMKTLNEKLLDFIPTENDT